MGIFNSIQQRLIIMNDISYVGGDDVDMYIPIYTGGFEQFLGGLVDSDSDDNNEEESSNNENVEFSLNPAFLKDTDVSDDDTNDTDIVDESDSSSSSGSDISDEATNDKKKKKLKINAGLDKVHTTGGKKSQRSPKSAKSTKSQRSPKSAKSLTEEELTNIFGVPSNMEDREDNLLQSENGDGINDFGESEYLLINEPFDESVDKTNEPVDETNEPVDEPVDETNEPVNESVDETNEPVDESVDESANNSTKNISKDTYDDVFGKSEYAISSSNDVFGKSEYAIDSSDNVFGGSDYLANSQSDANDNSSVEEKTQQSNVSNSFEIISGFVSDVMS